jgi:hypothetical protein
MTMATNPKKKSASVPAAAKRARSVQVNARLSEAEHADLSAVIAAWDRRAAEQGFAGGGFADWLRVIIRREKAALDAAGA